MEKSNPHQHPAYYGGADNPFEAIKVIDRLGLGFCRGNVVKYVLRAGKKDPAKREEDLQKALNYVELAKQYEERPAPRELAPMGYFKEVADAYTIWTVEAHLVSLVLMYLNLPNTHEDPNYLLDLAYNTIKDFMVHGRDTAEQATIDNLGKLMDTTKTLI